LQDINKPKLTPKGNDTVTEEDTEEYGPEDGLFGAITDAGALVFVLDLVTAFVLVDGLLLFFDFGFL
jgi:hypothetical protein